MKKGTLQFYSTGDSFTPYMRDVITEGRWKAAFETLESGGAPLDMIKSFFKFEAEFVGDTRNGSFAIQKCEPVVNFQEMLLTGLRTRLPDSKYNLAELPYLAKQIPDIEYLLKAFTIEEIINLTWKQIIKDNGFRIATSIFGLGNRSINGVIVPTGEFILCDYNEHRDLYPILSSFGFASSSDWTDDINCIHISSGEISGHLAFVLRDPEHYEKAVEENRLTQAQIDTLFTYRSVIKTIYGEYGALTNYIREYKVETTNKGGKFGNLEFLRYFYPNIKIPTFWYSEKMLTTPYEKVFMRTSPKMSLPGLLNSRLMNNTEHDYHLMRNFIEHEFEKVKDLRAENELHWFFQEYLEGPNGVAHYYEKGDFEYAISERQGDVVKGKIGATSLTNDQYDSLRKIASMLFSDLGKPIQLEFVVHNDEVYIVQLRILENNPETTVLAGQPSNVLYQGRTFSRGSIEVNVKDILIVDSEADSKELLGKKALIVRESPNFSHILALSKALKIPSMYAVGNIDLSDYDRINFVAYNKEAYICKL